MSGVGRWKHDSIFPPQFATLLQSLSFLRLPANDTNSTPCLILPSWQCPFPTCHCHGPGTGTGCRSPGTTLYCCSTYDTMYHTRYGTAMQDCATYYCTEVESYQAHKSSTRPGFGFRVGFRVREGNALGNAMALSRAFMFSVSCSSKTAASSTGVASPHRHNHVSTVYVGTLGTTTAV